MRMRWGLYSDRLHYHSDHSQVLHDVQYTIVLRSVKAGSDGVYTTKMAKHGGTKVKTEEKYKVTATQTHIYKFT